MTKQHCATGNPRGRPPRIPFDMDQKILDALRRRVNSSTGLVRPDWKGLARELHVSRSTIARQMVFLRSSGVVESVKRLIAPKVWRIYYRLNE